MRDGHRRRAGTEAGFALIVAIGVMFVTSLLVVAAFTAAQGDIGISHRDTTSKQAYYAALAGIQAYEYQLEANPDYWETCSSPEGTVGEGSSNHAEAYVVKPLGVPNEAGGRVACNASEPFKTVVDKTGAAANTFQVESIGTAGQSKRAIDATFKVEGFLNYVYFTQYEDEDPGLSGKKECERKLYSERKGLSCEAIVFVSGDAVNGPMRTDDAPAMCGSPSFGRSGHNDAIDFGQAPYQGGCEPMSPVYNNEAHKYKLTSSEPLVPPESDTALGKYVKEESSSDEFTGPTRLVLNGSSNTIEVTTSSGAKESLPWPTDGLIYVKTKKEGTCPTFNAQQADTKTEELAAEKGGCGDVYVSGTYSRSLTIGAENDLIINGEIYPTSVAGKLGTNGNATVPTGTETLGLIANNYVRVYHPLEECKYEYNYETRSYEEICTGSGKLKNPWIYAAILSTKHSFVVDNYGQGEALGDLNVYGAIAQNYRGIVGTTAGTGYIKDYIYDERLAVDEPPYFLSPLNSGWKVVRETTPESSNAAP